MALAKTTVNLSKDVKRVMSTILDREERGIYKRAMLDAEKSFMAGKNRKFSDPATSQKNREVPKE